MIKFTKTWGRYGTRRVVYLYAPCWTRPAWDPNNDTIRHMRPAVFAAFDRIPWGKFVFQIQFGLTYV
jgi:hypothetical protein